jgi:hypothetical protein
VDLRHGLALAPDAHDDPLGWPAVQVGDLVLGAPVQAPSTSRSNRSVRTAESSPSGWKVWLTIFPPSSRRN